MTPPSAPVPARRPDFQEPRMTTEPTTVRPFQALRLTLARMVSGVLALVGFTIFVFCPI